MVEEQLGQRTSLYRFPGGSRSCRMPKWLRPQLVDWLEGRGYTYYDWNAVSGDDTATVYPAAALARNILRAAEGKEELVCPFPRYFHLHHHGGGGGDGGGRPARTGLAL